MSTITELKNSLYKDMNLNYVPSGTNGQAVLSGFETIREALTNILFTDLGSRFFNRSFGCLLQSLLFEQMNENTVNNIQILLSKQIPDLEPRIELGPFDVIVVPNYFTNSYTITLMMKEKDTGQTLKMNAVVDRVA